MNYWYYIVPYASENVRNQKLNVTHPQPAQELFSILEVTETENYSTAGFAAPAEAVTIGASAMILARGLRLWQSARSSKGRLKRLQALLLTYL